ncbi:MAG TPA: amino acid--tRNA ligase-related protein [Rectinemataceae bacterium]
MKIATMQERSRLLGLTRDFFLGRDFIEADTPLLSPYLIPESCLEVFETQYVHPYRPGFPLYLVPSPEIWIKRLIAETGRSFFQISKAFRNAESVSPIHNPEFTMLEYYSVGARAEDNVGLTEELFSALGQKSTDKGCLPPFRRMTMKEAFEEFAGLDLDSLGEKEAMVEALRSKELIAPRNADWEEAFNVVFLSLVEPRLPMDKPLVLGDYPAGIECLAREKEGGKYKERWELYVRGIEVANCYTEASSSQEVNAYFSSQGEKKRGALVPHDIDPEYPALFDSFPPCSGVAVGFDRLAMVLLGEENIEDVMPFPFSRFRTGGGKRTAP